MPRKKPLRAIDIPRHVSYAFRDDPEDANFPLPTFIFVYADYAVVDGLFQALVGKDGSDAGIADSFTIQEEMNLPMGRNCAPFFVEVHLINPHRDFLNLDEVCVLVEHLMCKFGRALSITRLSMDDILNL